MNTVNFRCGHCGQLLAVQAQFLGQQVRCPHCQKVVVAPAAPPSVPPPAPPAPAPVPPTLDVTFQYTPPEEHESIFSAPASGSEDLFGQPSAAEKVDLPTEVMHPAPPPLPAPTAVPNLELAPISSPPPAAPPGDATLTYTPGETTQLNEPAEGAVAPVPQLLPAPAPEPVAWSPHAQHEPEPVPGIPTDAATAAVLAGPRSRSGWHIALFVVPVISWAVLATVAAIVLRVRLEEERLQRDKKKKDAPHPLEVLPDVDGEFPLNRKDTKLEVLRKLNEMRARIYPNPEDKRKLPKSLMVSLDQTLKLGDLEVTPLRVERATIKIKERGIEETTTPKEKALKLDLLVKNVSADLEFCPMDRYFTRYHPTKRAERELRWISPNPPDTYLEIGARKFYGGPAGFYDTDVDKPNKGKYLNEYVVGQEWERKLRPGESMKTFVCTDPENEALQKALGQYRGTLLWRVQVRRGAVEWDGRRIPCTAVIGVEFKDTDIKDGGDAG